MPEIFPVRLSPAFAVVTIIAAIQPVAAQTLWQFNSTTAAPRLQKAVTAGGANAVTARRELGIIAQAMDNDAAKDLPAFLKFDDAVEKQIKAPLILEKQ